MLKRVFIIIVLMFTFVHANINVNVVGKSVYITIDEDLDVDWIGIYKKGDSSVWENFVSWSWLNNLNNLGNGSYEYKINLLNDGEYELRFFDNSYYHAIKTINFKVANESEYKFINATYSDNKVNIKSSNIGGNTDSWVGVYKKGKSNDWENVLGWTWINSRGVDGVYISEIKNLTLGEGTYEARLFYNNSFKVLAVSTFKKEVSVASKKKIFLIGDSTVHNTSRRNNIQVEYGWGDLLGKYMSNSKNLFNLAEPWASSKSYKERSDLEYDGWFHNWHQTKEIIELTDLDNGGYLFIQFGHIDETDNLYDTNSKKTFPGVGNSFYNELKYYVAYARDVGLVPVLVTPLERMYKNFGEKVFKSHIKDVGDYAQTVRDLSQNEDVLLLDLQHKSWTEFNNFENSEALVRYFGYKDYTHLSKNGADSVALWMKQMICDLDDLTLCKQFK